MESIFMDELARMRQIRYRQTEDTCIRSEKDALDFVNDLGFCWFIDPSEADLPSVHKASCEAYRKSPGGPLDAVTWWDLKHTLSGRKECYYGKVLRGRGTLISWECFPFFYAAYSSGGDYLDDYRQGILSREEKRILDLLAKFPEISSRDLRKKFGPIGKDVTRSMDRALQNLQETFRVTVAGGSLAGWSLHNWALVGDWVKPEHVDRAGRIDSSAAKNELALKYIRMAVAASVGDIAWVFRWKRGDVSRMVEGLLSEGKVREVEVVGLGEMYMRNG